MRWFPLSGVAFVAAFGLAVGLYGNGAGSDQAQVAAYYASGADRLRQVGGFATLLAGCVLLLVYVAALVRDAVPEDPLATLALLSGGAAALALAVANALWAATALTSEIERGYRVSASTHLLVEDAGFAVFVTGMALAIPFVAAVSLAGTRAGRLPAWFGLLGAAAVAGLAAAYWYWPAAAFLVWIVCGSVLCARRRLSGSAAPTPASEPAGP